MAIDTISSKIFFAYFALVGALFVFTSGPDMLNDMVHVDKENNRVGNSFEGTLGELDDLTIEVGTVYCEVIGTLAIMTAMAIYFEGSTMRTFATQLPFVLIQAKHINVNGLIPPVPVMVLGGITLLAGIYQAFVASGKGTDYGKYIFIVQNVINFVAFTVDPAQIVKDTWPTVDGAALETGTLFVGVIQLYAAMMVVLFVVDGPLNQAVAMTMGMGQLYRDVVLNDSGPPLPVLVLFVVVFLSSVYGVVAAKDAPKKRSD